MNRTVIGCLLALACLSPFGIEVSANIHHLGTSATPTIIRFADGKTVSIGVGENYIVHEDVTVDRAIEYGWGWNQIPVRPNPHIVIRELWATRPEQFVAVVMFPPRRTIMLNYPPASSVWHLPAGIAQLAAVLKREGHEVIQRYGHIAGLEHLLCENGGADIDRALTTIRDRQSDITALYDARMTFERVSKSITTSDRFAVERNNVTYVSQYYNGTIEGALEAVKNRESHLWYSYFANVEIPLVRDVQPDLYGISVADERQFIQGIVLASMVKDALPRCLVVLGGNFWSRIGGAFKQPAFAEFFNFCDAIVYREGHQPLVELAANLSPAQTSGTVWRSGSEVVVNPATARPTSFETLPTPIFEGGERQWSPDVVYSLYTTSNCYMRCEFCSIGAGSDTFLGAPRMMGARRVAEHMKTLGTNRFEIFDEMFPIRQQLALGRELKRIGHPATWDCYLTTTNDLMRPEVCEQLYESGCRAVQLGLESLSPETLAQENKKWNTPKNYATILRNLKNAGIQTHAFLIVGIPGEPLHWGLAWAAFLEEYGENILTIKSGRYRMAREAPDDRNKGRNDLIELLPDTKPLHLNRDFRYLHTSRKKVEALRDIHEEACRRHWAYGVTSTIPWWVNRGRYGWDELRRMASALPKEPSIRHLDDVIVRANTIVKEELKRDAKLRTFDDIVEVARELI